MSYTNDLREMADKVFTADLLFDVMEGTDAHVEDGPITAEIVSLTGPEVRKKIGRLFSAGTYRRRGLLEYGFTRGLYAGFQHHFSPESTKVPVSALAALPYDDLKTLISYPDLTVGNIEFEKLCREIRPLLGSPAEEAAFERMLRRWNEQDAAILDNLFQLGLRAAANILSDAEGAHAREKQPR